MKLSKEDKNIIKDLLLTELSKLEKSYSKSYKNGLRPQLKEQINKHKQVLYKIILSEANESHWEPFI